MELKIICPICKNDDFIDIMKGIENKPTHMLKCTKCYKEYGYKELTPTCDGDTCNVK